MTCVHSLPKQDSLLLYPRPVSLELVLIEDCSHVYKTHLVATSQIVDKAIFPAFVLLYCSGLLVFNRWLTRYPLLTHTLFLTTLSSQSWTV